MGRRIILPKYDLTSETTQEYKTLHETLEEYLLTGVLDTPSSDASFDFNSADEVDFNKEVAHDVDLYDAAAGHDDPFLGVTPLTESKDNANNVAETSDTVIE